MSRWEAGSGDDPSAADVVEQRPSSAGRRWAVVAVVTLAVLGGWRLYQVGAGDVTPQVSRPHHRSTGLPMTDRPRTLDPLSIPDGRISVGNGVLMVTIPSAWAELATLCDRPAVLSVSYAAYGVGAGSVAHDNAAVACSERLKTSNRSLPSGVTFATYVVSPARVLNAVLPIADVAGKTLLGSSASRRRGSFERLLVMPADHLVVLIRSPSEAVVDTIAGSVAGVPRGYRAVPLCVGLSPGRADATLVASGFQAQMYSDPAGVGRDDLEVVTQAPAVGVIAPRGSVIDLGLLPQ